MHRTTPHLSRRHMLGCCAAAAAGLFSSLDAWGHEPGPPTDEALLAQTFEGLDASALWDAHAHLLGTGDGGTGCSVHAHLQQWWHPLEYARKRVIMGAAGVPGDASSIDHAYLARLRGLAQQFPSGARWLLYAFEHAHDDAGQVRPDWSTFHVPNSYAASVAAAEPERFAWVASIHPYRVDAIEQLDKAIGGGALAIKWLPSAMNIDPRDARTRPFYQRLAAADLPLIVHGGEEKAVPGAGRDVYGNPLLLRAALEQGVRVIVAHCASLGHAADIDITSASRRPAFDLFARLMDEKAWQGRLLGDVSAVFQANRRPAVWRMLLQREDWHGRLLHGSDYPLPGVGPLYRLSRLVSAGLLLEADVPALERLRTRNPLLFDLALKRRLRADGAGLSAAVFDTRAHFSRKVSKVSPSATA